MRRQSRSLAAGWTCAAAGFSSGHSAGPRVEHFFETTPDYRDPSSHAWNRLQMTGVIRPQGVFYQETSAA